MNARWAPNLSAAIELTGTDLDPGVLLHEWPGRVGARVRADAALEGERLDRRAARARGRRADCATARSQLERARRATRPTALRIDAFTLRSGSTDASARGTAGTELALEWRIESPDLGEVWPRARRTALGERRAARSARSAARRRRGAAGKRSASWTPRVDDFELTADVDVAGQAHSSLALAVSSAQVPGVAIAQLQLTGEGNAARHALALHDDDERRRRGARPDRHGRRSVDARFRVDLRARQGDARVPGARAVGAPRTCHRPRHEDRSRARAQLLAERHGGALRRRHARRGRHASAVRAFAASVRLLRRAARRRPCGSKGT